MAALQDSLEKSVHSELAFFALYWFVVTFPFGTVHILVMIRLRVVYGGRRVGQVLPSNQNRRISALDEETLAVLFLGKLCEDHGYTYRWTVGQKPHFTKNGKIIDCNISNYVPFVVLGSSTSSSATPTPTSSSFSSQDSVFDTSRYTENPVPERSGSMSEELRGNLAHKSTETENTNKNEGCEEVQSDLFHELPDWLQEFTENLVDERSPSEPRRNPELGYRDTSSSSHELPMES